MTLNSTHSDIFAGSGVIAFVAIHISQINEIVQIVAGVLTGIAALLSIISRFRKNKKWF